MTQSILLNSCCVPRGHRRFVVCISSNDKSHPHLSKKATTRRASLAAASLIVPYLSSLTPYTAHANETSTTVPTPTTDEDALITVTDRVYLDFGLCAEAVRANRNLGDKSILCSDPEPLGRVVIGLYGNAAPGTVYNFKQLISSSSLNGTCLSKILSGQWIIAGQQGSHRSGLLEPPSTIEPNPDLLSPKAFKLRHTKPGTVSLNLSFNEDEDYIRFSKNYRPLSFLITTGPAPAPSLDDENIVFGIVEQGLDVIGGISSRVPVFLPNESLRAYNALANFIGDERAERTKAKWGKPLKGVVITNSGLL